MTIFLTLSRLTLSAIFPGAGNGEKTPMPKPDGFPRAVRYALGFALALAVSLFTAFAFGGLP